MKVSTSRFALSSVLLVFAVLTAACAGGSAIPVSDDASKEALPAVPSTDSKTERGASALEARSQRAIAADFSVPTGSDSVFSLRDHEGEIVVLYFSFPG